MYVTCINLVKGTHTISKKPWNSIGIHTVLGIRICQVELRISSCVCVNSQEMMCPVYHRVYLVDKLSCVKIYFFIPATNYKAQTDLVIKIEI